MGVAERMGALYVPDCGVVPRGCSGWVGGCGSLRRVPAWVCACESALSSPKKGCSRECCFLSLLLSLTQLKQDFLVNPFNFGRPQGPPAGSIPFGLLKGLWGPLKKKSGHNSPWREAKTPEGALAPLL